MPINIDIIKICNDNNKKIMQMIDDKIRQHDEMIKYYDYLIKRSDDIDDDDSDDDDSDDDEIIIDMIYKIIGM